MVCCPLRLTTERCEAEGIQADDHDSEHGAEQLNSMHLPVEDCEHQLQVLRDWCPPAAL